MEVTEGIDTVAKRNYRRLTEAERAEMVTLRAAGNSTVEIAGHLGVSRKTVSQWLKKLRQHNEDASSELDAVAMRSRLVRKSYTAIEGGLDCAEDEYKRGNLGVSVLKGFGVMAPDNSINIEVVLSQIPEDWRSEYIGGGAAEVESSSTRIVQGKDGSEYVVSDPGLGTEAAEVDEGSVVQALPAGDG